MTGKSHQECISQMSMGTSSLKIAWKKLGLPQKEPGFKWRWPTICPNLGVFYPRPQLSTSTTQCWLLTKSFPLRDGAWKVRAYATAHYPSWKRTHGHKYLDPGASLEEPRAVSPGPVLIQLRRILLIIFLDISRRSKKRKSDPEAIEKKKSKHRRNSSAPSPPPAPPVASGSGHQHQRLRSASVISIHDAQRPSSPTTSATH